MDEGNGLYKGLKQVYGDDIKAVSCQWHFQNSYQKQWKKLDFSDGSYFEHLAERMLYSATKKEYEIVKAR